MTPGCNFCKIRVNFCCSLSNRSDENIATTRSFTLILIKQQNRSIQTIFSRRWCASLWCVYINDEFWSGWSRTLLKIGRIFQKLKALIEHLLLSSPWSARGSSRAGLLLGNARGRPWAGHEHIGPTCPRPARRALNRSGLLGMGVPEFTMYRRFIYCYFKIIAPLTSLFKNNENEKKKTLFKWSNEVEQTFRQLRNIFMSIFLFIYYDFLKRNRMKINVFNFAVTNIFSQ